MDTCQRQLTPAALKNSLGERTARSPAGTQLQAELKQHWSMLCGCVAAPGQAWIIRSGLINRANTHQNLGKRGLERVTETP